MLVECPPDGREDNYRIYFREVFRFISLHPTDHEIRLRLQDLLSVETCGELGIPIVALTMMDLSSEGVRLVNSSVNSNSNSNSNFEDGISKTLENGLYWLASLGSGEPGVTVLPSQLLAADPDSVVSTIENFVDLASGLGGEQIDLNFMEQLVLLACSITPHATQKKNSDIPLIRHLASNMAIHGNYQKARNLAEQVLLLGRQDNYRLRLAWHSYGDIYHRCHNYPMALLGLACAQAIDVEVDKTVLWEEIYSTHRVFRDIGLSELSSQQLGKMNDLLCLFDDDTDKKLCLLGADLNLKLMTISDGDVNGIMNLVHEAAKVCRDACDAGAKTYSFATLLGQAILRADKNGLEVPSFARSLWDDVIRNVGSNISDVVKTLSVEKPTACEVLAMFNRLDQALYATDIAHDYAMVGVAARRLLDSNSQNEQSCNNNVFATELLADHSIRSFGKRELMTLEWPLKYSVELNDMGVDVAFLALNAQDSLVVTYVSKGKVHIIEQPTETESFRHRFLEWLNNYPRDYGYVDTQDGNNIFYTSMEQLNICLPPSERIILVAEPFLQQLTANLVLVQPAFGGFSNFAGMETAIGTVPSLGWLSSARVVKPKDQTVYKAWISAEASSSFIDEVGAELDAERLQPERQPTLDLALSRLGGYFDEYGFTVDTGQQIPQDMKDATLAVITAHGGLSRDSRYLHRICDDRDLVESPSVLASALSGIELVILFVCSGGRIDKNPWSNSTTSLPKQLLNNGCRVVIASPWPLNVMVTYNWLGVFMREWEAGKNALDATKCANDAVYRHLGDAPQYCMAMRVYGDVLHTKS